MAFSLVSQVAQGSPDGNGFTTGSIDTTGAHLLVAFVASYDGATAPTLSDSKGNTWTGRTAVSRSGAQRGRFHDVTTTPTVGTGHTFTLTGSGVFASLLVLAFSESASPAFDGESAGSTFSAANSAQPGSLTPSVNDSVLITALALDGVSTESINGGFTLTNEAENVPGACYGVTGAYLIQTTAAAANPTWTLFNQSGCCLMAAYQPAGGGGGVTVPALDEGMLTGGLQELTGGLG